MKTLKAFLVVVVVLLVSATALAQTADEVIDRAVAALGGREAFASVSTMIYEATGTMSMGPRPMDLEMTSYIMRPNMFRVEMNMMGMDMVMGSDGTDQWMSSPAGVMDLPQQQRNQGPFNFMSPNNEPFVDLETLRERGVVFEYIGLETTDQGPAHHLEATFPTELTGMEEELVVDWFFGADSGLPIQFQVAMPHGTMVMQMLDYRPVAGLQMPYRMEAELNSEPMMMLEVQDIRINEPLDPSIFSRPN